ncbi:ABC transporter permease [Weissella oryzae SG25]|uniref:Putative hemin transport system permease protein HrtB n=1 Tax=Weissella oryzae (strain DSM 25784 / JCM 18191 / LMG 30913 / SG25) TaxID=1329250 RepID=A0A069CTE7_WEIOS|nr:FtsX-like permease family protein [Weissella oryzae]GAK31090.1 ABC transporter permease [Weissella oryzae SG25]
MYLAFKELVFSKWKYALIVSFISLIAFLIYFLSGLAFGLANNNRSAVDHWQAQSVYVTKYANKNLALSQIFPQGTSAPKDSTALRLSNVVAESDYGKDDGVVFSIDSDNFLKPKLDKGTWLSKAGEVVVDQGLADGKVQLGQKIALNGYSDKFTVVGLTNDNRYNTLPVIYLNQADYQQVFKTQAINGYISKTTDKNIDANLERLSIPDLIKSIPGYQPQVQTFTLMIAALFIIVAFIITIFMYILTIEKQAVYGIMRAQGISTKQIIISLIDQALLLGVVGVGLALVANLLVAAVIPAAVPYNNNPWLITGFSFGMIFAIVLGTIFSIIKVIKIDPLDALGGR